MPPTFRLGLPYWQPSNYLLFIYLQCTYKFSWHKIYSSQAKCYLHLYKTASGEEKKRNYYSPSIGQVKAARKRLNPKKATGYDGVPAWFLKHFHEELAPVIHDIICASILQCKYPTPYKRALVTPVQSVILST